MEELAKLQKGWNNLTASLPIKKLKPLVIIAIICTFALFATQSWKGDAGFPANPSYDFSFHAYQIWNVAGHIQHGNFFFDFDYKSNSLSSRAQAFLPYLAASPFVMLFGLWNGISYFVILLYFVIGLGAYALGRTLKLSTWTSLFLSIATLLSYALVLESQFAGGLARLFTYALFPWILICYFKSDLKEYKLLLPILIAIAILSHPLNAIYLCVIIGVLTLFEFITKQKNFTSSIGIILLAGIFAFLLSLFYLGPFLMDVNNGALVLTYTTASINYFGKQIVAPISEVFVQRTFGFNYEPGEHLYGYLGISLMLLSLVSLWRRRDLAIPFFVLLLVFGVVIAAPNGIPTILQAGHLSRPLAFMSIIVAILAAVGLETILETISQKIKSVKRAKIAQFAVIALAILILFVDLAPGLTTFPNGNYNQPTIKQVYSSISNSSRALAAGPYLGYGWSTYSTADFIQFTGDNTNSEYYQFVYPFFFVPSEIAQKNRHFMLDIETYILFDFSNMRFGIQRFNSTRVFQPSKTAVLSGWNLSYSEWLFEEILKQNWTSPTKIGFILPRGEIPENLINYKLVENVIKPNEDHIQELPFLFDTAPEGRELSWSKDSVGNLEITVDKPGWVFVSQMWYPHFRANGKPLQEAGGGLSAFYADAPGVYKIYWERPWYDYVFWAISIAALLLLIYLALNPKKHDELLDKLR